MTLAGSRTEAGRGARDRVRECKLHSVFMAGLGDLLVMCVAFLIAWAILLV